MTVVPRFFESFKSTEFDIEYFVVEAVKSNRVNQIMTQLDQGLEFVDSELRRVIKESSDIIISVANATDVAIGELLSARELFGALKDALEQLNRQEQENLDRIKQKHNQLKQALEVSSFVKKVSRVANEVAKLKAHYPDLNKERPARDMMESIAQENELKDLARISIIKDDVVWLETAFESRKKQESPPKRVSPSKIK